jgi:hypothetical protein
MLRFVFLFLATGLLLTAPAQAQTYNWIENPGNGHQYAKTALGITWLEAQAEAASIGVYLVSIASVEENDWVWNMYKEFGHFWTGFSDQNQDGNWVWESGEAVTYTNWGSTSPNYNYEPAPWGMLDYRTGGWANENDFFAAERFAVFETEFGPIPVERNSWSAIKALFK